MGKIRFAERFSYMGENLQERTNESGISLPRASKVFTSNIAPLLESANWSGTDASDTEYVQRPIAVLYLREATKLNTNQALRSDTSSASMKGNERFRAL